MSRPALELRPGQHLTLTPQLQQSIRLLQLSTLDLEMEISQALADNPMLERGDGADGASDGSGESLSGDASVDTQRDEPVADNERERADAEAMGEGMTLSDLPGSGSSGNDYGDDDLGKPESAGAPTLRDHLLSQLGVTRASERDKMIAALLIDELDQNGYLASPLEEIQTWFDPRHAHDAAAPDSTDVDPTQESTDFDLSQDSTDFDLAPYGTDVDPTQESTDFNAPAIQADYDGGLDLGASNVGQGPDLDELRAALALVQSFDPAGVGAANLSECLCQIGRAHV